MPLNDPLLDRLFAFDEEPGPERVRVLDKPVMRLPGAMIHYSGERLDRLDRRVYQALLHHCGGSRLNQGSLDLPGLLDKAQLDETFPAQVRLRASLSRLCGSRLTVTPSDPTSKALCVLPLLGWVEQNDRAVTYHLPHRIRKLMAEAHPAYPWRR